MPVFDFHSPHNRKVISIVLSSFFITFFVARLYVYLVLEHLAPNLFLVVRGVHIHHFTYGFFILAVTGFYLLIKRPEFGSRAFAWAALAYGVGLALAVDEFGMWVRLKDGYWVRQSYDAVVVVALLLINLAYWKSLLVWFKEFGQLLHSLISRK
jgi:hypothetical protein